jgi:DNA-binding PadR family transcriptional regulator
MRHAHHHHHQEPPWAAFMTGRPHGGGPGGKGRGRGFGPGGPFGFGFGGPGPRGPRARRGDVRAAILHLLAEEPRNGYALMQEIEERSGGAWRPSPGSVYPALQQLEDEGLIRPDEAGGRKAFALTDAGREAVEQRGDAPLPWEEAARGPGGEGAELRRLIGGLAAAAMQVAQVGTPDQAAEARRLLEDTRRALYRLLADEDAGDA